MDIDAEREKITKEIKELERILDPRSSSISLEVSESSLESDSAAGELPAVPGTAVSPCGPAVLLGPGHSCRTGLCLHVIGQCVTPPSYQPPNLLCMCQCPPHGGHLHQAVILRNRKVPELSLPAAPWLEQSLGLRRPCPWAQPAVFLLVPCCHGSCSAYPPAALCAPQGTACSGPADQGPQPAHLALASAPRPSFSQSPRTARAGARVPSLRMAPSL